jgi:hypothetical protein
MSRESRRSFGTSYCCIDVNSVDVERIRNLNFRYQIEIEIN